MIRPALIRPIATEESPTDAAPRLTSVPPHRSTLSRAMRNGVIQQLANLRRGSLTIHEGGDWFRLGSTNDANGEIAAQIHIHDARFYSELAIGGSLAAAEAFLDGYWSSPNLVDTIRLLARNRETLLDMDGRVAWHRRLFRTILQWQRRNSRGGSRKNIAAHYDLGNEFFELFLDSTMTYSSGIFPSPESTLEEASLAKYDAVCRTLNLGPDDHVLEIGTGWGGFAIHAARNYGCRVTTTTISGRQFELANERITAAGVSDRVTLLDLDYRDLCENSKVEVSGYDKLVSIEMIEAVGHQFLPLFFETCGRLLRPDGEMLLQAITIPDQRYETYRTSTDFIQKHIFPGGCLPSVRKMLSCVRDRTELQPVGFYDFADHYARTLSMWRTALLSQSDKVRGMGKDDAFLRAWDYYFSYCEAGFRERQIGVCHLHFAGPENRRSLTPM